MRPAARPPIRSETMRNRYVVTGVVIRSLNTSFVHIADTYAPTDMKPACPRQDWPVIPLIRFRLMATMPLMPHSRMMFLQYIVITPVWMPT